MNDEYNELTEEESRVILHMDTRHCVNSMSMQFYYADQEIHETIEIEDE